MKKAFTPREGRSWPGHILWGRVRTSTVVLLIAFIGTWWLYETYQPAPAPDQVPATNVVPPGFIPDPAYTWVPRTEIQRPMTTTTSPPPTATETTPSTPGADDTGTDTPTSEPQLLPGSGPAPETTTVPGTPAGPPTPAPPATGAPSPSAAAPVRPGVAPSTSAPAPSPTPHP